MRIVCLMNVWDSWNVSDVGRITVWDVDDSFSRQGGVKGLSVRSPSKAANGPQIPSARRSKSLDAVGRRSPLRLERIATIKSAIADGSYSVSAADLAEKLMRVMGGNYR